jgi:hypothetical protein
MTIASLYRLLSLSRIRPTRHAKRTRLANKAIMTRKALFPLVQWRERRGHEEGVFKSKSKNPTHAQAVRRTPLKPHLHAAARSTNR